MLLLRTRDTEQPEATAQEVVVEEAPARTCSTCAAPMAPDQDWCLECGSAAPGRLGGRPGWRAAGTIMALTLLLVGGAVAAGYAAVTQDAERRAGSPNTGDGAPIVAQPPAAPTPAPGTPTTPAPGATTPVVPTPKPKTPSPSASVTPKVPRVPTPSPTPAPTPGAGSTPAPSTSTPSTGGGSGSSPSTGGGTTGGSIGGSTGGSTGPATIDLPRGALETYDPYDRSGAEPGDPNDAADGSPSTSWDLTVPADGEDVGVGLLVDLGRVRSVRSLQVTTSTGGWKAEVYASSSDRLPTDILDKRWKRVTDVGSAKGTTTISLANAGGSARRVVLWFKKAGPPRDAPKISIGEVVVRGG